MKFLVEQLGTRVLYTQGPYNPHQIRQSSAGNLVFVQNEPCRCGISFDLNQQLDAYHIYLSKVKLLYLCNICHGVGCYTQALDVLYFVHLYLISKRFLLIYHSFIAVCQKIINNAKKLCPFRRIFTKCVFYKFIKFSLKAQIISSLYRSAVTLSNKFIANE